ncbi:MAG: hypothetical protein WCC25_07090, partial [Candidatus Korobacteraceae bacterium]
ATKSGHFHLLRTEKSPEKNLLKLTTGRRNVPPPRPVVYLGQRLSGFPADLGRPKRSVRAASGYRQELPKN